MRRRLPWYGGAVVVSALAAWLTWLVVGPTLVPPEPPVGDRVQAAVDGLRDSNVYVAPEAEGALSDEQVAAIDQAAKASEPEVVLVVWADSSEAGYYLPSQGLEQVGKALGRDAVYASFDPRSDATATTSVGVAAGCCARLEVTRESMDDVGRPPEDWFPVVQSFLAEVEEAGIDPDESPDDQPLQYWGGVGGAIAAGVLMGGLGGLVAAGVAALAIVLVRRR